MKFLFFSLFLLFCFSGCGVDICVGSDDEIKYGICLFLNEHDVDSKVVERIVETTRKRTVEWDNKYTDENTESFLRTHQVSIMFEDKIFKEGEKEYIGFCRHVKKDIFEDFFEIGISTFRTESASIYILIHEVIHLLLIGVESDYSHRGGWFSHRDNSDYSNRNSLQGIVYSELKSEKLYVQ